jgi:nodulation protein E
MERTRVVVTGLGAVSAAGVGVEALWTAARAGRSCIGEAKLSREGSNRVKIAAQLKDFRPEEFIDAKVLPYCDRFTQFALVASDEALTQAELACDRPLGARTGVIIGTGVGGITTIDELCFTELVLKGRPDPLAVPRIMGSAAASQIGMRYGCTGPTFGVTSACSSGAQAIGIACLLIRAGIIDRAIAGGSDSTITPLNIRAWETLRVLTPDFTRPFSIGRNGMVLGEGAAVFLLESERAARARGVVPVVDLAGYGTSSDALDIVRPDIEGAATAMRLAIEDAGLAPDQIDYVNAHGTGTVANDIAEAEALQRVFGRRLYELPVSSTKPIHGHTLGAAGAVELAVTIMALQDGIVPPTINWLGADPKVDLDPVPNEARSLPIRAALSNSFAFGGINACLVVTRPQ